MMAMGDSLNKSKPGLVSINEVDKKNNTDSLKVKLWPICKC